MGEATRVWDWLDLGVAPQAGRGTSSHDNAWHDLAGGDGRVCDRLAPAPLGMAGVAWQISATFVMAQQITAGVVRCVPDGTCKDRQRRHGALGKARRASRGSAGMARHGSAFIGGARSGNAGQAALGRPGLASHRTAAHGRRGLAWRRQAPTDPARNGMAGTAARSSGRR